MWFCRYRFAVAAKSLFQGMIQVTEGSPRATLICVPKPVVMLTYSLRSIASITTGYSKARPLGEMAAQRESASTTCKHHHGPRPAGRDGPRRETAPTTCKHHHGPRPDGRDGPRQETASKTDCINTVPGPLGEMTRAVYNKNRRPALGRPFYCLLMANR